MPIKTFEVNSQDLNKPIDGFNVECQQLLEVKREVLPIVFVPGIMGSRLKNQKGKKIWDPDDILFMVKNYGRRKTDAQYKRSMVIGENFDPGYLEVLNNDKKHNKKFALKDEEPPTREERGWGGVSWKSYGTILKLLQNRQWYETVDLFFDVPVHAFGYNWSASNDLAGKKLAEEIDRIIEHYKKDRICEKVILVTHSMGGPVARSACMFHGAMDKVLGIVHGVQPSDGAPAAYWRMKGGFERPHTMPDIDLMQWLKNPVKRFKHMIGEVVDGQGVGIPYTDLKVNLGTVTAWVLGSDGEEVTALLGNMPGGLELLPNKQYKNNDGWERWLEMLDARGDRVALPTSNPYNEIYRVRDVYYRLINPDWLNPGKKKEYAKTKVKSDWQQYLINLDEAETFHNNLALALAEKGLHPETFQFYSSGVASADRVIFTSVEDSLWEAVKRKFGVMKSNVPGYLTDEAARKVRSLVFKVATTGGASLAPILIDAGISMAGKIVSATVIKDSDVLIRRGGYRDRVNEKHIPTEKGELQLVTMQLPDGSGDGTVPESSARALKLAEDKKRTFCIGDKSEFERSFVEKHKRLKPKQKPDYDEGYFDRGHEGIYKTRSAQLIAFTAIENICLKEIRRKLGTADGGKP